MKDLKRPSGTSRDENLFEMKNSLGRINRRLYISEEKICELEGKAIETTQKWNTEKRLEKNQQGISELWGSIKWSNKPITGSPKEKWRGPKKV